MQNKLKFDPEKFFSAELKASDFIKTGLEIVLARFGDEVLKDNDVGDLHRVVNERTAAHMGVLGGIKAKLTELKAQDKIALVDYIGSQSGRYSVHCVLPELEFRQKFGDVFHKLTVYAKGHKGNEERLHSLVLSLNKLIYGPFWRHVLTAMNDEFASGTTGTIDDRRKMLPVKLKVEKLLKSY